MHVESFLKKIKDTNRTECKYTLYAFKTVYMS